MVVEFKYFPKGSPGRKIAIADQDNLERWLKGENLKSLRRDTRDGIEITSFRLMEMAAEQKASTTSSDDEDKYVFYYPGPRRMQIDPPTPTHAPAPNTKKEENLVGNMITTLRSTNNTELLRFVLMNKVLPMTAPEFWSLVEDLTESVESKEILRSQGFVTVRCGNKEGESGWVLLSRYANLHPHSLLPNSDGNYEYQVRRHSATTVSPMNKAFKIFTFDDADELKNRFTEMFNANPFSDDIPSFHIDQTCEELLAFIARTPKTGQDIKCISTVLAMPGAGKTRSVTEAVRMHSKGNSTAFARFHVGDISVALSNGKSLAEVVQKHVQAVIETLPQEGSGEREHGQTKIVIHYDEIQSFLSDEKNGMNLIKDLAGLCNQHGHRDKRLKFVITGTNINANQPIYLGSARKFESIHTSGSLPMDFVRNLYKEHFQVDSIPATVDEYLERSRHNRRVTQLFMMFMKKDEEPEDSYKQAVKQIYDSIASQIQANKKQVTVAACRIFRILTQALSDEQEQNARRTKEFYRYLTLEMMGDDLDYVLGGGLNVYLFENEWDEDPANPRKVQVYYPEGCVFEILSKMTNKAVKPETLQTLLDFLRISSLKPFNIGNFFEALVVHDLKCEDSEFERLLDVGTRHPDILTATPIEHAQLAVIVPSAPDEQVIWWVRDEMNRYQNRWIDIAYRSLRRNTSISSKGKAAKQQKEADEGGKMDSANVILECKSGLTADLTSDAKTFFSNARSLAKKHPNKNWVAVFLCVVDVNITLPKATANLTSKIVVLPSDSSMAQVLSIVREGDKEVNAELASQYENDPEIASSSGACLYGGFSQNQNFVYNYEGSNKKQKLE